MINMVTISPRSRDLFPRIRSALLSREGSNAGENAILLSWLSQNESQDEINTLELVTWLSKSITLDKETQFLLETLRAALLQDLFNSIPVSSELSENVDLQSNEALFRFLTIAGTIVAICEGFDGIVSIIGLFPAVPQLFIFIAGIVFAALSVIVFCGFDLVAISKNLGVDIDKSHQLIDVFLEQVEQINKLREVIAICSLREGLEEQKILLQMSNMLTTRYSALDAARETYESDLNAPYLTTAKLITSAVAGVLFFGAGFFSGQSLALAVAGLFSSSVSAICWPIIIASSVVGLAAFSIYWFVERPGLESLVSRWHGMDEEKIHAFTDDNLIKGQRRGLAQLVGQVTKLDQVRHRLEEITLSRRDTLPVLEDRNTFFGRRRSNSTPDTNYAAAQTQGALDGTSLNFV